MTDVAKMTDPIDNRHACWACGAVAAPDAAWSPLHLWRCPACGLMFAPERTAEQVKALYDAGYFEAYPGGEAYTEDAAQRRFEAQRRIAWLRGAGAAGRLLEIGAAAGHFVEAAGAAGFDAMGIEPAAALAAEARARGVHVEAGFLEDLNLPDGSVHVACAWHVVEHIADPLGALERVRAVLRPGAPFFVEVPNIGSAWATRRGLEWVNLDPPHHVAHYTGTALSALLERAGFTVRTVETISMLAYLRPGRALRPRELAAAARELAVVRAPRRRHPWRHELLRVVAVAGP
jgi:SAM-dependent methyltransferase